MDIQGLFLLAAEHSGVDLEPSQRVPILCPVCFAPKKPTSRGVQRTEGERRNWYAAESMRWKK
jgi:hypothetical protein